MGQAFRLAWLAITAMDPNGRNHLWRMTMFDIVFVNLIKARLMWEEGSCSTERMLPPDWHTDKSVGHFLD